MEPLSQRLINEIEGHLISCRSVEDIVHAVTANHDLTTEDRERVRRYATVCCHSMIGWARIEDGASMDDAIAAALADLDAGLHRDVYEFFIVGVAAQRIFQLGGDIDFESAVIRVGNEMQLSPETLAKARDCAFDMT